MGWVGEEIADLVYGIVLWGSLGPPPPSPRLPCSDFIHKQRDKRTSNECLGSIYPPPPPRAKKQSFGMRARWCGGWVWGGGVEKAPAIEKKEIESAVFPLFPSAWTNSNYD